MALTENSTITEITRLPLEGNIQVKWRNTIEKDGEVISAKDHYRLFGAGDVAAYLEAVPDGANDVAAMGWQ